MALLSMCANVGCSGARTTGATDVADGDGSDNRPGQLAPAVPDAGLAPTPVTDAAMPFTSEADDDDDDTAKPPPLPPPSETDVDQVTSDSAAFKTTQSRDKLSEFLVKPATAAMKRRAFNQAITYYRALTTARGAGSDSARQLATALRLDAKSEEARRVLADYLRAGTADKKALEDARIEYDTLAGVADPFAKRTEPAVLVEESKESFKRGRAAYKKKAYADALFYFELGYVLAPDLPGFLRELGATYDQLGAKDKKIEFYRRYLRRRPFGKTSDEIRKELGKEKGALSTLSLASSVPCDEVWMNGQQMPGKLPRKLQMAPGLHRVWCISWTYELLVKEQVDLQIGKDAALTFEWAIFVNALENPFGRMSVEHADMPGVMLDLGISSPEVGVLVPADGRALRVLLKDDAGTRQQERYIKLSPGQREVIKW